MRIDAAEIYLVGLPLKQPLQSPCGVQDRLETLVVCLRSGDLEGWGEASPGTAPVLHAESAASAFVAVKRWLAPMLVGKEIENADALQELLAPIRGNQFAKAAIDVAWWDLVARSRQVPLWQLLGSQKQAVEVGVGFDRMDDFDHFLQQIAEAFAAGFSRVELKMRPGWDLNMLNAVRQEFPTQTIHVDIEGAMRLENMETIYRLDDFCLAMAEQPLPAEDLVGMAMAQEGIRTPLSLDESIQSLYHAELAVELKSGQFINLKIGRTGGITPVKAVYDLCTKSDMKCYVGSDLQGGLAMRAAIAVAGLPQCEYPADFIPSEQWFAEDVVPPLTPVRENEECPLRIQFWQEPGLGITPDRAVLQQLAVEQAIVTA